MKSPMMIMKLHLKNVKLVIQLPYHLIKLYTMEEERIKEQNVFMKCDRIKYIIYVYD